MKHEVSRRQLNINWSTRKGGRDRFATTNVQGYPVTTAEYLVNDVCDVRWMSAVWSMQERVPQVEEDVHETSKNGTRAIATTAATRGRVASQVYFARGHVVTGVIDVFQATTANHAGCRGAQSNQMVRQSPEMADVYVQIAHDHVITIGDLNTKKVFHRRQGTTATSVNVDHSSENGTHGPLEAVDTDAAIDSSRISVRTEDRLRELCGLGPLHGLRPPRLPCFLEWLPAKWFPLHHPEPATTRPLMRGHPVRGPHAQTPCVTSSREFRLALSPPPVRRYDHGQHQANPGWRRVGTHVPPGRVVARDRGIVAVLQHRRRGVHLGKPRAHGMPGRRKGAPRAVAAPKPKTPAGLQYMSSPSAAAVVVIVGVVVVLLRGGKSYAVVGRAQRRQFPVVPEREATSVMRLRPPTPRCMTARRECECPSHHGRDLDRLKAPQVKWQFLEK
ncbi:uncharacterized protein LOC142774901 [Rhipicephalus microplus]|uniref:uncharacterized protein LOC142774901 n=1 Tax=Rhipicephalus microplus TaxID=6941 RepID=UPI003F6BD119